MKGWLFKKFSNIHLNCISLCQNFENNVIFFHPGYKETVRFLSEYNVFLSALLCIPQVARESLVLRLYALHLQPNFRGTACWVAELKVALFVSTLERSEIFYFLRGKLNSQSVALTITRLWNCATTDLTISYLII